MNDRPMLDPRDENAIDEFDRFSPAEQDMLAVPLSPTIPVDDGNRHVLIVEPSGATYVAPHLDLGKHPISECERVGLAVVAFLTPLSSPAVQPIAGRRRQDGPGSGRYWISTDEDGNLEIGSRLPDFEPAAVAS